jgi:predicted ATP pyrophosphatase (TIGR00289 family)
MKVAILFSGGKDSIMAVDWALENNHDIEYLLSVKPNRTDCYLFHYATVEHTKLQAESLGLPHIYITCNVANPVEEAKLVKSIISTKPVDAVVLGGIGLQETQIRSIKDVLEPLGIKVFAAHESYDHTNLMKEAIKKGYDIRITAVASDGLGKDWLGRKLDVETFNELVTLSEKYGFHIGGEGGYFDTFVCDGPIFNKQIELFNEKKVWEKTSGHIVAEAKLLEKRISIEA